MAAAVSRLLVLSLQTATALRPELGRAGFSKLLLGIEPRTSSLPRRRSTTELQQHYPATCFSARHRRRGILHTPADQTGIGNCKTPLRLVKRKNWRVFPALANLRARLRPGRFPDPAPRQARSPGRAMWANLLDIIQEAWGRLRPRLRELPRAISERLRLSSRASAVRIGLWTLLVIGLLATVRWAVLAITAASTEPVPVKARRMTTIQVACVDPACRASFRTRQTVDFRDWPMKCERCGALSVYRAQPCPACKRWFAVAPGQAAVCPFCPAGPPGATAQPRVPPAKPAASQRARTDDDDDPWR